MRTNHTTRLLPIGALVALGLSSCSMPTSEAWRQIRQEGLITYWINNNGDVVPAPSSSPAPSQSAIAQSSATKPATAPSNPSVPAPSQLDASSMPVAQAVPGLDGYVRSPFTNPPRLVDVRGMTAGSKVVCPYTRRPFVVPNVGQATQAVASAPAEPQPAPVVKTEPPVQPKPTPAPTAPSQVAANTKSAPQPPPAPEQPKPQVKNNPPAAPQQPTPPVIAPKTAAAELPFGSPIPGRPGFVNSPYAAKHQLVDVTGLPTGMEVKCPYTGKLFRVPPQANDVQKK